jgi:hypothetical protein
MKSPARSRRHKTVEPIDFRDLLNAPALNGLKEALAHRRETEADLSQFPAPPAIPTGERESTAVVLNAPEPDAVESTAGEFHAVELIAVGGTSAGPPEFLQPEGTNQACATDSDGAKSGAVEFTALQSEAHAPEFSAASMRA